MVDKILGEAVDKTGATVTIKFSSTLGNSSVLPFFLKNFAELMLNGHTQNIMAGSNRSKVVYAEINGHVAGHIVFDILDDVTKTAWIVFSCIDPNFRKRGIYDLLHAHFETVAKEFHSQKIASFVHVNNTARQASCKKVGMEPVYYRMEKVLS
jgi:RimJ/RimL family protein N-acetyltransferase